MIRLNDVRICLTMNQAKALLYYAEIGDKRLRESTTIKGGSRHGKGALAILSKTILNIEDRNRKAKP